MPQSDCISFPVRPRGSTLGFSRRTPLGRAVRTRARSVGAGGALPGHGHAARLLRGPAARHLGYLCAQGFLRHVCLSRAEPGL